MATMLVLALMAAACGDDDASGGTSAVDPDLVSGLTEQILTDGAGTDAVPLDDEQAACFAVGLIEAFGGERMVDALGVEFEDFMGQATADERLTVVDTMFDCVDFGDVMATQFGESVSAESARCASAAFVESDAFRVAIADSLGNPMSDPFEDPGLIAELLPAMLDCFTADELIQLGEQSG
jgi:hypothetical protein